MNDEPGSRYGPPRSIRSVLPAPIPLRTINDPATTPLIDAYGAAFDSSLLKQLFSPGETDRLSEPAVRFRKPERTRAQTVCCDTFVITDHVFRKQKHSVLLRASVRLSERNPRGDGAHGSPRGLFRPANSFAVKAAIRINRNLLARYIDRYHARIIERTKNRKYDYVFFIKGESVSVENLNKIKELHPEAKLIIYHWDSIANNRNALRILPVFDRAFSFDKPDCEKLGIRFLPLFYLRDYEKIGRQEPDYRYDLLFVGTVHSDRYGLLRRVSGQIERAGGRCFAYMFFQSRVLYWKMKLQNKSLRGTSVRDFRFAPLPKAGLLDLYRKSRAVIDIQHPRQTGLTMRCIETMGAKRKLITTNGHIAEYDFYDPNNILIVDRQNPVVPSGFTASPYRDIPAETYDRYRIDRWLETILKS